MKEELRGELPVIVFAGAPFTVATYCIGTGKDMAATRRFAAEQPAVWDGLLEKLSARDGRLPRTRLIADGADVYQLFDSWAGMLTPDEYDAWAQPHHGAIFAGATGVPRILFVKECPYLDADGGERGGRGQPRRAARPGGGAARLSAPRLPGQRRRGGAARRERRSRWRRRRGPAWRRAAGGGTSST